MFVNLYWSATQCSDHLAASQLLSSPRLQFSQCCYCVVLGLQEVRSLRCPRVCLCQLIMMSEASSTQVSHDEQFQSWVKCLWMMVSWVDFQWQCEYSRCRFLAAAWKCVDCFEQLQLDAGSCQVFSSVDWNAYVVVGNRNRASSCGIVFRVVRILQTCWTCA